MTCGRSRLAAGVALSLLLAASAGAPPAAAAATRAAPPSAAPKSTRGHADLYRDSFGVPHIYAATEEDGFYALGYAQAGDGLEAYLAMALAVEGRSASVYGKKELPWGGAAADIDRQALLWRFADNGRASYGRLPLHIRRLLDAHAAGFNAYMRDHPEKTPAWAPKMEAWKSLAWPQLVLWFFNVGDGVRKCAISGAKLAATEAPTQIRFASDEWAVAPSRTRDHRTFLLTDPHGPIPPGGNPFYEFRMKAGGLDLMGYTLGALPALSHNQRVAWGLTTGGPDVSDCYRLKVDGNRYSLDGQWRPFEIRKQTIQVAGGAPIEATFRYARINGRPAPVVGEADGAAFAVSTPYIDDLEGLQLQVDAMIRAHDVKGLMQAAVIQGLFPQNVLAADAEGHIAYLRGGRTPIRPAGPDWTRAVSGDDPKAHWSGIHPVADLVQVIDPPTGYLENDNTTPDNMTKGAPLVRPQDYPADIWNADAAQLFYDRAGRTNEVLDANAAMSVDDAIALALDQGWYGASNWTAVLAKAAQMHPTEVAALDPDGRKLLDRLLGFDGIGRRDSQAALDHHFWRSILFEDIDGPRRSAFETEIAARAASEDLQKLALAAIPQAVARLKEKTGSVDSVFGDWIRIGRTPARTFPVGGAPALALANFGRCTALQRPAFDCAVAPRAFIARGKTADGRPMVTDGSRALSLVAFGPEFMSFSVHNYGQSDDPKSPHYDDQAEKLASGGKLKRLPVTITALTAEAESHLILDTGNVR